MEDIRFVAISGDEIRQMVAKALADFFSKGHALTAQHPIDEIGGIELAMAITGLAKPTIYSRVSNRSIPHRKQGKRLYFSREELTAWIEEGRRPTRSEIQAIANS